VRELDELVSELLTLSRLEQGDTYMTPMGVSVDELLDSMAAMSSSRTARAVGRVLS